MCAILKQFYYMSRLQLKNNNVMRYFLPNLIPCFFKLLSKVLVSKLTLWLHAKYHGGGLVAFGRVNSLLSVYNTENLIELNAIHPKDYLMQPG